MADVEGCVRGGRLNSLKTMGRLQGSGVLQIACCFSMSGNRRSQVPRHYEGEVEVTLLNPKMQ